MHKPSLSAAADGFVPARLTIARNARAMKQNELATAMNRTPATISRWESASYGLSPDFAAVAELSERLSVEGSWFYKPLVDDDRAAFFRSMRSELSLARDKVAAKLRFVDEIYVGLLDRVEFPELDIPDLMGGQDYRALGPERIEHIAESLRDFWGLSDDPIDDVMLVIENAGVAVAEDFADSTKLDGVSRWFGERAAMLLAKDKNGGVRRRFDAAHELGHLVLHKEVVADELKRDLTLIEEQAMAFAGAFLMPASSFSSHVYDLTLDALADIKPQWKVSIGAMIKRLRALNLVSAEHERNLWKYYSYRRWHGDEPFDESIEVERPVNLRSAMEMIVSDGAEEVRSLLAEIALSRPDVAQLTGVTELALATDRSSKPKLQLVRREPARDGLTPAND